MKKHHPDHPKPVTRRDFLSHGLVSFSALSFLPTPFSILRSAWAEECGGTPNAHIPFLVIDCAGGAALPANFLVGGEGGAKDLLKRYSQLGWDPKNTPDSLDESFGLPMAKKESKLLEGIVASASVDARARVRMGSFCHSAQSDNSSNPLNASALVSKLGYQGRLITQSTGNENSVSGGNSELALPTESFKALYIPSVDTLKESVVFSGSSALGSLSSSTLGRLFRSGKSLSKAQINVLEESVGQKLLDEGVRCSYQENDKKASMGGATVDPRIDPNYTNLYNINQNSQGASFDVVSAAIVKNVLGGTTGPGVITIGGCDYHNNDQAKSDAKDREIGVSIGRAVEAAHREKKPLFFQVITDGGCSNQEGTRIFVSDANEKCMTVIGYYRPEGAMAMVRSQVGHYTEGQGAAKEAVGGLGSSPLKVTASVFANYLSLHVPKNQLSSEFFKVVPSTLFNGTEELERVLFFGV